MMNPLSPAATDARRAVRLKVMLASMVLFAVVVAVPTIGAGTGTPSPLAHIVAPSDLASGTS